jgi:hypothetical protein
MKRLREVLPYVRFALLAAILYSGWLFWSRRAQPIRPIPPGEDPREAEFLRTYGGSEVKILQFYAREGNVTEGNKSVICYGVLNARAVRMEPPVEGVTPSLNKCVEIAPEHRTQYTLIAEGKDGRTVSETFELGVVADPDALPKITSFEVKSKSLNYLGNPVYFVTFTAQNPEEVSIDPPAFPLLHRAPYGRFYVAPRKTTTYTLTVTGKFGHADRRQLTLEGPR